jgi:hypothetical protein
MFNVSRFWVQSYGKKKYLPNILRNPEDIPKNLKITFVLFCIRCF